MFERELVSESVRCAAEDRGVADGVQRRASAQQLGLPDAKEFAERARVASYGKDGDEAALENASAFASGVSHFPTAPAAAVEIEKLCRNIS